MSEADFLDGREPFVTSDEAGPIGDDLADHGGHVTPPYAEREFDEMGDPIDATARAAGMAEVTRVAAADFRLPKRPVTPLFPESWGDDRKI